MLDVFECARSSGIRTGQVPAARLGRLAASVESIEAPASYRWSGSVDRRGDPGGRLEFEVDLGLRCDLCGGRHAQRIAVRREFRFVAAESDLARRPVEPENETDWLVGSVRFDLADLIDEEAVLALPLSPRHPGCQAALEARPEPGPGASLGDEPDRSRPFSPLARLKPGPH